MENMGMDGVLPDHDHNNYPIKPES